MTCESCEHSRKAHQFPGRPEVLGACSISDCSCLLYEGVVT